MTWVFFLSLWHCMVSSWFMETPFKDKTCTNFSRRSWLVIDVRTLCSPIHSQWLYWATFLVTISILVNCALISKFYALIHNSFSLVSVSSSLTFLNSSIILPNFLERSVIFPAFQYFQLLGHSPIILLGIIFQLTFSEDWHYYDGTYFGGIQKMSLRIVTCFAWNYVTVINDHSHH